MCDIESTRHRLAADMNLTYVAGDEYNELRRADGETMLIATREAFGGALQIFCDGYVHAMREACRRVTTCTV